MQGRRVWDIYIAWDGEIAIYVCDGVIQNMGWGIVFTMDKSLFFMDKREGVLFYEVEGRRYTYCS